MTKTTTTWSTRESGEYFSVEVIRSQSKGSPSTVTVKVDDIRPITRDSSKPVGGHMVLTSLAQVSELTGLLERAEEEASK